MDALIKLKNLYKKVQAYDWKNFLRNLLSPSPRFLVFLILSLGLILAGRLHCFWDFDELTFCSLPVIREQRWDYFRESLAYECCIYIFAYGITCKLNAMIRGILFAVLFGVVFLFDLVNDYLILRYSCPIQDMVLVLNCTDLTEIQEYFLSLFLNSKLFLCCAFLFTFSFPFFVYAIFRFIRGGKMNPYAAMILCSVPLVYFVHSKESLKDPWERIPMVELSDRMNKKDPYLQNLNDAVARPKLPAGVKGCLEGRTPVRGIFLIGESDNRIYHSIYGYDRVTDPNMAALRNDPGFFRFTDAISPTASTQHSLYCMFSDAGIANPEHKPDYVLCDAIRAAGAKITMTSVQRAHGAWSSVGAILFSHADSVVFLSDDGHNHYDEEALPGLKDQLAKQTVPAIHVVHMMGSHYEQQFRFPPDWIAKHPEFQNMSVFDQSIAHTDEFLEEIHRLVDGEPGPAFFLYVPDHSEMPVSQRSQNVPYPEYYEIPMILYCNQAYRTAFPDVMQALKKAQDLPYQTDRVLFLVMRLMNVPPEILPAEKDILSEHWQAPAKRLIGFGGREYVPSPQAERLLRKR